MKQQLAHIALMVADYDEAIAFYTGKLNFQLTEDTAMSATKRWVVVTPPGSSCSLLLAKAANERQVASVGNQAGGRVFLFLHTSDFDAYFQRLVDLDVKIVRQPAVETWGKVAVFEDLYGNPWDLIEQADLV